MSDASVLLRHMPGLGNPLELPIDDFNGFLRQTILHLERQSDRKNQNGPVDHRALVEQQMRKLHG